MPQNVIADAGYGSEENYAYLDEHKAGNYVKYNTFYQDTHKYRDPDVLRKHQFRAKDNRQIQINFGLLAYRQETRANLTSEKGIELRKKRSTDVESVFGLIKQNMGFRRFHLRGLKKVTIEWGLVSIAHNLTGRINHCNIKHQLKSILLMKTLYNYLE